MDKRSIPKRMNHHLMPKIPSTFQTLDHTLQTLDSKHLSVPGPATSLRNYAALFMLDHAKKVEKDLGLSLYTVLKPVLTDNFVCHHRYLTYGGGCTCACFQHCPEPTHPLHLAIAHGLDGFVREFLFGFSETTTQDSPEWDDVFYLDLGEAQYYRDYPVHYEKISNRISLLEFALWHASKQYHNSNSQMQIVTILLESYSRVQDAEMVYVLQNSAPKIVKLLLAYWLDRDMLFDVDSMRHDCDFDQEINSAGFPNEYRQRAHTRPLWHIARRKYRRVHQNEELLDIFLERGENINGQCGPVGTALHANLQHLPEFDDGSFEVLKLLIEKGADVNAHGPFGKPLEFVWQLAHTRWRKWKYAWKIIRAIE